MQPEISWSHILELSKKGNYKPERRVEKTPEEWQKLLSPESFRVTRNQGTESPFSSDMCSGHTAGKYSCICCDEPLFDSTTKFNSGTGWPSFSAPVKDNVIKYISDTSHSMTRVEVQCSVCDSHLGHVFPDGPSGTGLRYCINAVSLKKTEE